MKATNSRDTCETQRLDRANTEARNQNSSPKRGCQAEKLSALEGLWGKRVAISNRSGVTGLTTESHYNREMIIIRQR